MDSINDDPRVYKLFDEVKVHLDEIKPTRIFRSSAPNYEWDEDSADSDKTQDFWDPKKAFPFLRENNIDTIISFNNYPYDQKALDLLATPKDDKPAIEYFHFGVKDMGATKPETLREVIEKIKGKKQVLIHCGYGHGRTGTMVSALQLYCTKGKYPEEKDWEKVNHVETGSQKKLLRQWIAEGSK